MINSLEKMCFCYFITKEGPNVSFIKTKRKWVQGHTGVQKEEKAL